MNTSSPSREIPTPLLHPCAVAHVHVRAVPVSTATMSSVGNGQQPGLDQDQSAGQPLGIVDVEIGRVVGAGERERRVPVRSECTVGVEGHPPAPADDPDVKSNSERG